MWGLAVLAAAALAGCSGETGTPPQVSTSTVQLGQKINLLEQDACYTQNPVSVYRLCGSRYMTEVSNVSLTAVNETAGSPAAAAANKDAATLRDKINNFNGHSCADGTPATVAICVADLRGVNASLASLGKTLPNSSPGS
jgi:hypothetical protein